MFSAIGALIMGRKKTPAKPVQAKVAEPKRPKVLKAVEPKVDPKFEILEANTEPVMALPKVAYYPQAGQFLYKCVKWTEWHTEACRERFHSASFDDQGKSQFDFFYFGIMKGTAEHVTRFMSIVDSAAESEDPVVISLTTNPLIVHVKMSSWWAENPVRRNVLTAFLRAGQHYTEDTGDCFEKAVDKIEYLRNTRKAVDLFLSGRSRIRNKKSDGFTGWYNQFRGGVDPESILVKLKRKRPEEKPEDNSEKTEPQDGAA